MRLMNHSIQGETHEAKGPDKNAIDFVPDTVLPQKVVRSLVKANELTVHEVAHHQHHGNRQPPLVVENEKRDDRFTKEERRGNDRKCGTTNPMDVLLLDRLGI